MSNTNGDPRARLEGVIAQELESGETVVYDRVEDRAHCLNHAASVVWRHCDGVTPVPDIARALHEEAAVPEDEGIVDLALAELNKAKLIEPYAGQKDQRAGMTRRQAMERLGYGAAVGLLLPLVISIVAPSPAAAASCLPNGARCSIGTACCSGNCVGGICVP